jgi:hypothetical protein
VRRRAPPDETADHLLLANGWDPPRPRWRCCSFPRRTHHSDPRSLERRLERALVKVVRGDGGPPGAAAVLRCGGRAKLITAGVANARTGNSPRMRPGANSPQAFARLRRAYRIAVCALLGPRRARRNTTPEVRERRELPRSRASAAHRR